MKMPDYGYEPFDRSRKKEGVMGNDDKVDNKAEELKGRAKETVGDATGDEALARQGRNEQRKGSIKQAGEKIKDAFKK